MTTLTLSGSAGSAWTGRRAQQRTRKNAANVVRRVETEVMDGELPCCRAVGESRRTFRFVGGLPYAILRGGGATIICRRRGVSGLCVVVVDGRRTWRRNGPECLTQSPQSRKGRRGTRRRRDRSGRSGRLRTRVDRAGRRGPTGRRRVAAEGLPARREITSHPPIPSSSPQCPHQDDRRQTINRVLFKEPGTSCRCMDHERTGHACNHAGPRNPRPVHKGWSQNLVCPARERRKAIGRR